MLSSRRRILVVRHGERCDYHFKRRGIQWLKSAVDDANNYTRFNTELPENLPLRDGSFSDYYYDTPITQSGLKMAIETGKLLKEKNITVNFVYTSPALRCVQSGQGIINGLGTNQLKMFVEPGLYQWTQWCEDRVLPKFMSANELLQAGYTVDPSYNAIDSVDNLDMEETLMDYYNRSHALIGKILQRHDTGTVLCIAHAGSLDTLTRQLCRESPLERESFIQFLRGTSYLSCVEVVENESWHNLGSPIPSLSSSGLDRC